MTIAATVTRYLAERSIPYSVVVHDHTSDSMHTAEAAHVPGDGVAKAVVLKDERGYLAAVLPATRKLVMDDVHQITGRRDLRLASEGEIGALFADCELGAIPAVPAAYHLEAVWDGNLIANDPVYVEGGDHVSLIRVSRADFQKMMATYGCGVFSDHA